MKINNKVIIITVIIIGGAILLSNNIAQIAFNYYCGINEERTIYSVNTHGPENVSFIYLYLFNKNKNINQLLENNFFNETQTRIFFNDIRLSKGDVAWFLYSDINFDDNIYNMLLERYNITTGMELFFKTMRNPLLRRELIDFIKTTNNTGTRMLSWETQ